MSRIHTYSNRASNAPKEKGTRKPSSGLLSYYETYLVRVKMALHGLAAVCGVSQLMDVKSVNSRRQTGYVPN